MATVNYDPNARYDHGPNAAGTGRVSVQGVLQAAATPGLASDSTLAAAELRVGFGAAGIPKDLIRSVSTPKTGPNVAGNPRSINNT
jgi:hypothetical protein